MKVNGFTFIRNAIRYDYPVVESIRSILPLCSKVIVAVGNSDDGTLDLIRSISPEKVQIIETIWDDSLREGGRVLAQETDKAFRAVDQDADWAIYLQADEVIHEKYLPVLHSAMQAHLHNTRVDGLLLNYLHFYGSYDYVGDSTDWYPHEIRVVRRLGDLYSYRDAQGFRKGDNQKLRVKPVDVWVYHYGWVKEPKAMQRKQETFHKLWHDDQWLKQNIVQAEAFDYAEGMKALRRFEGTHPEVMRQRIERLNWEFNGDISFNRYSTKDKIKRFLQEKLGIQSGYKNYIPV